MGNTLLTALPLGTLALGILSLRRRRAWEGDPAPTRSAFLIGSTLWGALVAGGACVVVLRTTPAPPRRARERLTIGQRILVATLAAIVGTIALVALVAPPNTWDSMDYHLPRVLRWIQHGTLDFYPTHCPRQNRLSPGAEMVLLHFHLLAGSDRFANLVQWYAMIGCLIASGALCARFGAGRTGSLCGALFIATIPMGVLEASSTYNDYLMTFWTLCFAWFTFPPRTGPRDGAGGYFLPGLSLGLAVLTKGTAYVFAFPFLVRHVFVELRARRLAAAGPLLACASLTLCLNAGHYARCADLYGNPLGLEVESVDPARGITDRYSNEIHTPRAILSNLVRNVATHFQMTPSLRFNLAVEDAVVAFHERIGFDVDDPRTTWATQRFRSPVNRAVSKDPGASHHYRSDEGVSNPLHLILIAAAFALALGRRRFRMREGLVIHALCCAAGFLLFCACLKWQPWHSRLHLSLFVFSAPVVAATVFDAGAGTRAGAAWRAGAMGLLVIGALPFLLACEFLEGHPVATVGLLGADWAYPLMVLLLEDHPRVRFVDVNVDDRSRAKGDRPRFRAGTPDAIVTLRRSGKGPVEQTLQVEGRAYHLGSGQGYIAVYLPAP